MKLRKVNEKRKIVRKKKKENVSKVERKKKKLGTLVALMIALKFLQHVLNIYYTFL